MGTNLKHALKWYGKAADQKHPQSIFNIAAMLEDHSERISIRDISKITKSLDIHNATNHDDLIVQLYKLCSTSFQDELGFPCYLGLIRKTFSMKWNSIPILFKVGIGANLFLSLAVIIFTYKEYMENQQYLAGLIVLEDGPTEDNVESYVQTNQGIDIAVENENYNNPSSSSALTSRNRTRLEPKPDDDDHMNNQGASSSDMEINSGSVNGEDENEEDKKDL